MGCYTHTTRTKVSLTPPNQGKMLLQRTIPSNTFKERRDDKTTSVLVWTRTKVSLTPPNQGKMIFIYSIYVFSYLHSSIIIHASSEDETLQHLQVEEGRWQYCERRGTTLTGLNRHDASHEVRRYCERRGTTLTGLNRHDASHEVRRYCERRGTTLKVGRKKEEEVAKPHQLFHDK